MFLQWKDHGNHHNSSLLLKLSPNLELLVNQFNNATPGKSNGPEKVFSFMYYCIMKCVTLKNLKKISIP